MKKFILFTLLSIFMLSCADDSWKQELEEIKAELANQKNLIEALQQNATITSIEQGEGKYTIHFSDGQSITLSNGKTPIITIGENGNWYIDGVDTGKPSQGNNGSDGQTPSIEIGENGNWIINGADTGIKAEGVDGNDAPIIISIIKDYNNLIFIFSDNTQITCPISINNNFSNKEFFSLFDSLGEGGFWQNHLADISGMSFDQEKNFNNYSPISYGGSTTGVYGDVCGMTRAKNLVNLSKERNVDYLFIENINDINYVSGGTVYGNINDRPWFNTNTIQLQIDGLSSYSDAVNYWNNNFTTILNNINERQLGSSILIPYKKDYNATRLIINNKAINDGSITINIGGKKYGISVTKEMSIEEIINLMIQYNYGPGWNDYKESENSIILSYYTDYHGDISIETNNTGIKYSKEEANAISQLCICFIGDNIENDWYNKSKWTTTISLYSQYKGLLEYLLTNLPTTKFFWFIPTTYGIDFKDIPLRADGTIDIDAFNKLPRQINMSALFKCQKEVAKFYNIPILDMNEESGINIYNVEQFYNNNNVHPKLEGYQRWAETIYRMIN